MRPSPCETGKLQGQTLLLVDDERLVLRGLAAMLRWAGCEPLLAATGREALALCDLHGERLATVILDLQLPGEDPAALFAAFRRRRPELPIILTSGLPEGAAREGLGRSDLAGFLPKPFRMEELLKTLGGALEACPATVEPRTPRPERAATSPRLRAARGKRLLRRGPPRSGVRAGRRRRGEAEIGEPAAGAA